MPLAPGPSRHLHRALAHVLAVACCMLPAACQIAGSNGGSEPPAIRAELRGTWLTTTGNDQLASPQQTAQTLRRLRETGLNTVYLEVWKNGYTQFPSAVLVAAVGQERHPALVTADGARRDLAGEMLLEAHRNGLVAIAWFEYGLMAAHGPTHNALRQRRPDWLLRDAQGGEIAPDGFVWMNPLHPQVRRFLIDLVLEAVERYDFDGIQFDDHLGWPHPSMGYDETTRQVYAAEHAGRPPPADPHDQGWLEWRTAKVSAFARELVGAVRAKRPGLVISLSPAVFPWSREHSLVDWPRWAAWPGAGWDEFVAQAYRLDYPSFDKTWREQVDALGAVAAGRRRSLIAGIRISGTGAASTWEQLRDSILLTRSLGNGGHALWFGRDVLEKFPRELAALYAEPARNPHFPAHWREASLPLFRDAGIGTGSGDVAWFAPQIPAGRHRLIGFDGRRWEFIERGVVEQRGALATRTLFLLPAHYQQVELLRERREELGRARAPPGR